MSPYGGAVTAPTPPTGSVDRADQSAAVEARAASVALGGHAVWEHLDLTVRRGEFVAVLGPNGVGKSTLVKAILGLIPLASGDIEVLGASPGERNSRIGYLPQRRSFDPGLRVRGVDIVRLGLDGDRWGLPFPGRRRHRQHSEERIADVIAVVDAAEFAGRPVGEVSGGEQQRLLIAQALVRQPELLLLDEPLDSLDIPNQASVAALVARICDAGVTVIMVAHDVNPILAYLDRVVYLGPGGAISGAPEQVITSANLTRLFRAPIEVLRTSDGRLVVVGQPEPPAHHTERHTVR